MLSGRDGVISSKRSVMFIFTLLFVGLTIGNFVTGKNFDEVLKQQLFYILIWLFSLVFGEQIPDIMKAAGRRKTSGKEDVTILGVDVLPSTGEPGIWYLFQGNYYYWNGASFVNTGGDRPNNPPPNP